MSVSVLQNAKKTSGQGTGIVAEGKERRLVDMILNVLMRMEKEGKGGALIEKSHFFFLFFSFSCCRHYHISDRWMDEKVWKSVWKLTVNVVQDRKILYACQYIMDTHV